MKFQTWFGSVEITDDPVYKATGPAQHPKGARDGILLDGKTLFASQLNDSVHDYVRVSRIQVAVVEEVCKWLLAETKVDPYIVPYMVGLCAALRADAQRLLRAEA